MFKLAIKGFFKKKQGILKMSKIHAGIWQMVE